MIDIETYHKARELREKGMKRSGILQELNISKTAYNRYTYLTEDTFLYMYN